MTPLIGMIIEDDSDLLAIFTHALKSAGYETEVCQTGTEALRRLQQVTPHLIVLDLHLPEVSGVEVLSHIQADSRFAKTRIVVSTADPLLADTLRDKSDLVLVKPVSYRQLTDLAARFYNMA